MAVIVATDTAYWIGKLAGKTIAPHEMPIAIAKIPIHFMADSSVGRTITYGLVRW